MINLDELVKVEGERSDKVLVFMGLSTCGFCRRARKLLEENGWAYYYAEIDKMEREKKIALKKDVKERFVEDLLYPILIIDDSDYLKGFKKELWLQTLS